ncbi:MAG: hypothetical protein CM1200mP24_02800 [Gammaproteobacteria bacterium]|nr:MAG: hypothetical protein CM1200mP24_02800 [Gammaproteobacteria bacterium]
MDFMGKPEWAMLDVFNTPGGRNENQDVIHTFSRNLLLSGKRLIFTMRRKKAGFALRLLKTFAQLDRDPHLAERNFFEIVEEPKLGPVKGFLAQPSSRMAVECPLVPRCG